MSDSDEIHRDIKPYYFVPLAKKVANSINCEELVAASAYMDPEQPPVPTNIQPPSTTRVGLVCIYLCWYKSTYWA